jgi:competence CoiA-like predicted nuclease
MRSKVKIPFAIKNGRIVHISEVENGLACDSYCCLCGAQLIAKNNESNIKEAHFAHYDSEECGKALETSIHLAAKQFLLETKKIVVPDILYFDKSIEISFEKVEIEKSLSYDIRVDAFGHINNVNKLIVEFAFTHMTGEKKKKKFNKLKIPAIEVSLNHSCYSFEDIEKILLECGFKKWLFYSIQDIPEINSYVQNTNSKIETLMDTLDLLKNANVKLVDNNRELEKTNEELRCEIVKLKRNMKGFKA